ncbi:MAG: protein kinase [Methanomicrobiales archaeon]|nr:protein kinase [Methanomicrobiales archaeon]
MRGKERIAACMVVLIVFLLGTIVLAAPVQGGTMGPGLPGSTGIQGQNPPDPWHWRVIPHTIPEILPSVPAPTPIPTSSPDPTLEPSLDKPSKPTLNGTSLASQIGQGSGGPPEGTGSPLLSANRIVEILSGIVIAALGIFVDLRRYPAGLFRPRVRGFGIVQFLLTAVGAFLISTVLPVEGSGLVRSISIIGGVVTGSSCALAYGLVISRRLSFTLGIHLLGSGILVVTVPLSFISTGGISYPIIAASALFTGSLLYTAILLLSPETPGPDTISLDDKTLIGMDMADPRLHTAVLEKRYTDIVPIATGGLARVYRAVRKDDGLTVAVKIPLTTTETTGRAFLKEMLLWRDLNHPNIVKVTYVAILPIPLVEMEYIEMSLSAVPKPLPLPDAIRIITGIAQGLAYAHSKGIIHRDIKPANILLDSERTPKITDWGLGRSTVYPDMPSVTGFSLSYAAPEQVAPSEYGGTDHRTDIFQLGVVSFELVTGRLPFQGEDLATITRAVLTRDPVFPLSINPEARPLDPIILRCLSKDPRQRYQSVKELLVDLAGIRVD